MNTTNIQKQPEQIESKGQQQVDMAELTKLAERAGVIIRESEKRERHELRTSER